MVDTRIGIDGIMNQERWDRIKKIFLDVCEQPPDKRIEFLNRVCGDDESLKTEVIELLRADSQELTFLDSNPESVFSIISSDHPEPPPPERIGPYQITREIDRGGMGIVYEATDIRLDRKVALKILPFYLGNRPDAKQRFITEAKAASRLDHPNIVTIYEIDETDDGQLYMAMAYYDGETLKSKIDKEKVDTQAAIEYMSQIAGGLEAAHNAGIVHCDIKPANIFITGDGRVKILDFGIAKLRESEDQSIATAGTIAYMSPEQLRGERLNPATDIWSLGVTMFEALTGNRPFQGDNKNEIIHSIKYNRRKSTSDTISINSYYLSIIDRCLRHNPGERYATGKDLVTALLELKSTLSTQKNKNELYKQYATSIVPIFIILGLIGFWFFSSDNVPVHSTVKYPTLAILPFLNLSGDDELQFVSEGLTDELIYALSGSGNVRIPSRSSMSLFSHNPPDIDALRSQLNVDHVFHGRLENSDEGIQIQVQLINTHTGSNDWMHSYAYETANLLDIQRDISDSILHALSISGVSPDDFHFAQRKSVHPDAYADYLRGRYQWNQRTSEGLTRSLEFYNRALRYDPEFALAYSGIAQTYALKVWYSGTMPDETYPHARSAAMKALSIDTTIAEAYTTLGSIYWQYDRNRAAAESVFRKALELNPNDVSTNNWFGEFLIYNGRFEEGIRNLEHALRLDPLSLVTIVDTGTAYYLVRDYDRALEYYTMALDIEPRFALARIFKGMTLELQGYIDKAIVQAEQAISDGGPIPLWRAVLARLYAVAGDSQSARNVLAELHDQAQHRFVSPFALALVYLALGDDTTALDLLRESVEVNDPFLVYFDTHPGLDSIRNDARFLNLAGIVWK